jgi:hypothetical protein
MNAHKPIRVDVLAYAPTAFFHCRHCEVVWQQTGTGRALRQEQLAASLPADLMQQYQQVSDWVLQMAETYGSRLQFRMIDAASLEGWFTSLRYWVRRYPAVIVDGRTKFLGPDLEQASALIRQRVASPGS